MVALFSFILVRGRPMGNSCENSHGWWEHGWEGTRIGMKNGGVIFIHFGAAAGPWGTPVKIATDGGNTDGDENCGVIFIHFGAAAGPYCFSYSGNRSAITMAVSESGNAVPAGSMRVRVARLPSASTVWVRVSR